MSVYKNILERKSKNELIIAALLDPDSEDIKDLKGRIRLLEGSKVDFLFVGGSTSWKNNFKEFVGEVKANSSLPVVIFPGSADQISSSADALLFPSLVSGQNPRYLIGEHIRAASILKGMDIEVIPTGYLLIDGGRTTTVEFISGTKPIPQDKPEIARSIAYASELLGMKLIYLDSGSGAKKSPCNSLIKSVKDFIDVPLVVGGGIRSPEEIEEKHRAGADLIVIGTALEDDPEFFNK
ncbi:MAG: geranylgeranylglyceryl/heptaprenylglyceryl phosphate synthase [candidate division WOR-3 bacterium]|nr:geranylgeranylglyceryl/heptaprenylglyceryl phosphate synthase [candidate division WOR-3 bacterium]